MAPSAPTPGLPQGAECRLASGSGMLTSGSSGGLAGGGGLARGGGAGMAPYPAAGAPGWQPAGAAAAPGAHQAPALSAGPYGAPPGFFPQYGACPVLHPNPLLMFGALPAMQLARARLALSVWSSVRPGTLIYGCAS